MSGDQEATIENLRRALRSSQLIVSHLKATHPLVYDKVVSSLPPEPTDLPPVPTQTVSSNNGRNDGNYNIIIDDPGIDADNNFLSEHESASRLLQDGNIEQAEPQVEEETASQAETSSTFTEAPLVTEEEAGTMMMESRNAQRDAFFKARIAHGIDDSKKIDLAPKLDCKAVVSAAEKQGALHVLNAMQMYPEMEAVQRRSLKALITMTVEDDVRQELGALSAVRLVSDVMSRYESSEGVSHHGIRVVSNLCFGSDDNRAVAGVCAVDPILRAMSAFPNNMQLQGHACLALTNISHGNDANKRAICNKGGAEAILNTMEKFLGDGSVQKHACWALLTIAAEDKAASRCASDGAVGALLAAMVNFEEDRDVNCYSIWGLLNIARGGHALAKFVCDSGAPALAQRAVVNFQRDVEIVDKATALLQCLDKFIPKVELGDSGGMPMV